ncbi:zinc hook domain protein, partial [mine drainage metagenome]
LDSRIGAISPEMEKYFGSGSIDSAAIIARINELESEIEELGKRITVRKSELGSRNERKRELTSRIDQLEGKSVCPLCGSDLSAEHISRLQTEIDESVQATLAEIGTIAGDIARLTADQERMKQTLSQMRSRSVSEFQQAMDSISSRRVTLAALQKDEELLRNFHEEFVEKRSKAEDLERRIESLRSVESDYSGIKARLEAAETAISGKEVEDIGSRLAALREEIS